MSNIDEPGWERRLVERLALEGLKEGRRKRQWGVLFKILGFAYVGIALFLLWNLERDGAGVDGGPHTALIQMDGVIGAQDAVKAEQIVLSLQSAFEAENAKGVVLSINSPGGSPVQAGLINDEIRRLRARYPNKALYAVVEDVCASGGYYVAVAADKIFVDKASIVGSIGVRMDGFGFVGAMEKLGVERRTLTAGENKAFLDPFLPVDEKQAQHAKSMLAEIHRQFIDVVRKGRGARLRETPEMFSGLFWSGARSVELGLTDGFGSVDSVARDIIKAEEIRDYTQRENIAERLAKRFGADVMMAAMRELSRVGLR